MQLSILQELSELKEILITTISTFGIILVGYWQWRKRAIHSDPPPHPMTDCPQFKLKDTTIISDLYRIKLRVINEFHLDPEVYARYNLQNIENIFRDMMYNKCCIFIDVAEQIIDKFGGCDANNKTPCPFTINEAYNFINKKFNAGLDKFIHYPQICPNLNTDQKHALKVAIPLFNAIHQKNVMMFRDSVDGYLESAHLTNMCVKTFVYQCLILYVVGMNAIWIDIHKAMTTINGELTPLKFDKKEYEF
jgi:hypothetical protein